mmetsp:Transcript_47955/g.104323  ORF Transcript_47955/g.104323 Transcript_47955/m.104323 type:complete len:599 (+) Transcript_47955:55-1851(+)
MPRRQTRLIKNISSDVSNLTGSVSIANSEFASAARRSTGSSATGKTVAGSTALNWESERTTLVDSKHFSVVMGAIVIANVILVGIETDAGVSSVAAFDMINNVFLLIYLGELCLRLLTYGIAAMRDGLTVIDLLLVIFAFIERVATSSGIARSLSTFRLLRLMRLIRAAKNLSVSVEMRTMLQDSMAVARALGWASLILLLLLWACGLLMREVIGASAAWVDVADPALELPPFTFFDRTNYFGSMSRSILTMLQVVTLSDWADQVARPLLMVYPALALFFFPFLLLTSYGLIMAITASMIQESIHSSRDTDKAVKEAERSDRLSTSKHAVNVIQKVDMGGDGDGYMTAAELQEAFRRIPELPDLLTTLQLPEQLVRDRDAEGLIRMLDVDGDGKVSYQELIEGMVAMGEVVKPCDITKLSIRVWSLLMRAQTLHDRLKNLQEGARALRLKLEGAFGAVETFLRTREASELHGRALRHIRSTVPVPPPLAKGLQAQPRAVQGELDESRLFIAVAGRCLGNSRPPEEPKLEPGPGLREAAHVGPGRGLPTAPASLKKQIFEAMQEREAEDRSDKYRMDHPLAPSPSLLQLRELLDLPCPS